MYVCQFLSQLLFWMPFHFFAIHWQDLRIQAAGIGMLIGTYHITTMAVMLPFGILTDRMKPIHLMLTGLLLQMVYFAGLGGAQAFHQFLPIMFLGGVGTALYGIPLMGIFYKGMRKEKIGTQISRFQIARLLAFGFGPLLGGALFGTFGMRGMVICSFGVIIALALCTLHLPNIPIHDVSFWKYREDLMNKEAAILILSLFSLGAHLGTEQSALPLFLKDHLGFSARDMGRFLFMIGIWLCMTTWVFGRVFDRRQNVYVLFSFGILISGCFHLATAFVQTTFQLIWIRMLHTCGDAMVLLSQGILIAQLFPDSRLGGHLGLSQTNRTIGVFAGALTSGYVMGIWGYHAAFLFGGSVLIGSAVLIFCVLNMKKQLGSV